MGLKSRYQTCMDFLEREKHAYCAINNSPHVEDPDLRVQTNLFGDFPKLGPFPIFFT